ncbi:MAG: hypothetical protein EOP32_32580 [Rhodococcus sp. (in: high G+C Gram-positive bacteria)]|nr:MAG: hypothetical protein EOP32_32580 [Rhodococcus sp. (in: high G+C Gram-positive bacteria)]
MHTTPLGEHLESSGRGGSGASRSSATPANETVDVTPVTFERYPSVSFAVSLPSIAHRSPPR